MDKQPINYLDLEIEDNNPQWMKLVDYVNQREEETFPVPNHFITYETRFDDVHMFSKRMWFVKWLVKNNKIDENKIDNLKLIPTLTYQNMIDDCDCWKSHRHPYTFVWKADAIYMLLSIEDNPVTFMLSILK